MKKTGNISKLSQKEIAHKLGEQIGILQEKTAVQGKVAGISSDPSTAINDLGAAIRGTKDEGEKKLLTDQKKSLEDVVKLQSSFSGIFEGLQKGTVTPEHIAALGDRVEKSTLSDKEKALYKDLIGEMKDVNKGTGPRKLAATKAKIDKMNLDKTEKIRQAANKRLSVSQSQLTELEVIQGDMGELNRNNKTMMDYAIATARSDPKVMKQMAEDLVNEIDKGATKEDLASSYSLEFLKDIEKNLTDDEEKTVPDVLTKAIEQATKDRDKFNRVFKSKEVDTTEDAGIIHPQRVTSAGAVILHPDEMILPKSYSDFKQEPTPMMPEKTPVPMIAPEIATVPGGGAAGTAGGAAGGKATIEITINANERDLPERIANVCRRVINEYQMP